MQRSLLIFYAVILYAVTEMIWWGVLILQVRPDKAGMILGEGAVFILLITVGVIFLHKSLKKEHRLRSQQRNFLLSVTHELKSPLASIKLYLQTILKRDLERSQINAFLNNSLKDIERLDDLVENMLIATRMENRSYSFPKEEFDFSNLIEKVSERLQVHTCSTQTIYTDVQPNIKIKGDKFALSLVVSNLIENAVKYSPACDEVNVSLAAVDNTIVLRVADKGVGIPDSEKEKIFEKFYRVGSEDTRKTKGTGLGLFIVKEVLKVHQAQIRVKNNKPEGTIFEVTFSTYGN